MTFTAFKSISRAALVALTLGAATMTAMPAQAQSGPSFSFQFGAGNDHGGMGFSFGNGHNKKWQKYRCATNWQIERGIERLGYRHADVVRNIGKNRVLVVAQKGHRDYVMKVNKCTGDIYDVKRLKHRRGQPGFSLQFNF